MAAISALRILVAGAFVCLMLATAACAGSGGQPAAALPADCILVRMIRDYDALDADDLLIYVSGGTAYHVVLATPSRNIEGEFMIEVFDDGDGRLCPYGRDSVMIDGPIFERIRMRSIESIDEAELEALLVEFGEIEAAAVEPEQIL